MENNNKFKKLTVKMMAWAEKNKYQTSKNSDFVIPDHPDRERSWQKDLKLIYRFESEGLTPVKIKFLNMLWRTYSCET